MNAIVEALASMARSISHSALSSFRRCGISGWAGSKVPNAGCCLACDPLVYGLGRMRGNPVAGVVGMDIVTS